MGQKNSMVHAIDHETIKVRMNAHCQSALPGQDLTLKIAQIFFEYNVHLHEEYWRKLIMGLIPYSCAHLILIIFPCALEFFP